MCGIAGILLFRHGAAPLVNIQRMMRSMRRRGPDDEGYIFFTDEGEIVSFGGEDTPESVYKAPYRFCPQKPFRGDTPSRAVLALGHRRLSILGISSAGHQPMCSDDSRFWIVYNGEVYNYREIRAELESFGEEFVGNSDTEVILKAYKRWGQDCVTRFNGMWAFAIWDTYERKLFCSRDRIGIKPFYYYLTDSFFLFASDVAALIASGLYVPKPDWESLYYAMSFCVAPRPLTCFKDVRALEQAHWITVDLAGRINKQRFWSIPTGPPDDGVSEAQWIERIEDKIRDAVKRRLVADVPVGTFMSGGLDSTTMSAIAAQEHPGIKAFTLAFEEDAPEVEELSQAKATAGMWPMEHVWDRVSLHRVLSLIREITLCYEEPFLTLGPLYILSEFIRKHDVKVVLNGLGPDELFFGYGHEKIVSIWQRLYSIGRLFRLFSGIQSRYAKYMYVAGSKDIFECYVNIQSYFYEKEKKSIFNLKEAKDWDTNKAFIEIYNLDQIEFYDNYQALCYMEIIDYIGNHQVYRNDKFTMFFSLESRFPYLDHELVELSFKIPSKVKMGSGEKKYLFRKIASKYIHPSCLQMPKKGFGMPMEQWMRGELCAFVKDKLDKLQDREVFKASMLKKIYEDFYSGKSMYQKLWYLVSIELWLEHVFENNCIIEQ